MLEAIKERGEVITKVAYGDWKRSGEHGRAMAQHAVRMVQRVMTPGGDKNGADINLALDALEMAFTHSHINAFVIVGGDSDFITLVEKLKQYDRKVFVVGGRAFTSQVMQKNCTEFIAYENVVPDALAPAAGQAGARRAAARIGSGTQSIEQAVPLVKRALKVLTDREVSPQLGLLKSTLLQLDSSFSERDYGVSTFREFADKLREQGLVSLKHQGRSTLVELPDSADPIELGSQFRRSARAAGGEAFAPVDRTRVRERTRALRDRRRREILEQPDSGPSARGAVAWRRCGAGSPRARRSDDAAALADVSATVQAVPEERAAGFRRAQVRIDRRPDARLPEGRPPAPRARSPGRPARVRRRQRIARGGAARLGRAHRENGGNGHETAVDEATGPPKPPWRRRRTPSITKPLRRIESTRSPPKKRWSPKADAVIEAQVTQVIEQPEAKPRRATRARKTRRRHRRKEEIRHDA